MSGQGLSGHGNPEEQLRSGTETGGGGGGVWVRKAVPRSVEKH